jgi:hypothetical protein
MITALLLAAPAMAGEIVKCVDGSGHVTLTDQPCDAGAATFKLAREDDAAAPRPAIVPASALRRPDWQRQNVAATAYVKPVRLARDVETLKAAHRTMLMQDAKPRLVAGLN